MWRPRTRPLVRSNLWRTRLILTNSTSTRSSENWAMPCDGSMTRVWVYIKVIKNSEINTFIRKSTDLREKLAQPNSCQSYFSDRHVIMWTVNFQYLYEIHVNEYILYVCYYYFTKSGVFVSWWFVTMVLFLMF